MGAGWELDGKQEKFTVIRQKDIARHLGISRSTVAQALNGIGRVNPETHARVLKAAHELGYRPNPMARALVTGKTHTLAFWYFPLLNEVSMGLINRLQMLVPPYGLVSMNLGLYRSSWEEPHEEFPPGEWPVDGIFAFRTGPLPRHVVHRTVGKPPIVYIGYDNFHRRRTASWTPCRSTYALARRKRCGTWCRPASGWRCCACPVWSTGATARRWPTRA
jgi:transcriptional regulator with XRE-family HTH domain